MYDANPLCAIELLKQYRIPFNEIAKVLVFYNVGDQAH